MTSETHTPFQGFQEDHLALIRLPEAFFTQLLPIIENMTQLRLLLYLFWHLEQQTGNIRYFLLDQLASDPTLIKMTGDKQELQKAIQGLVDLGAVLAAKPAPEDQILYFINGPQGRAAVEAIQNDEWQQVSRDPVAIQMRDEQPNIFKLYEENIGVITPMMAEILKDDEVNYPSTWIEEAIRMAVTRNIRSWKYVQAILKRWQKEGRSHEQDRRNDSQDPGSYRESWLRHE